MGHKTPEIQTGPRRCGEPTDQLAQRPTVSEATGPARTGFDRTWEPIPGGSIAAGQVCALAAAGIGLAALLGWVTGWRVIATFSRASIPMAPSSALAFLALGSAIYALARWSASRLGRRVVLAAVVPVSLAAFLVVAEFATGVDLDLEQMLVRTAGTFKGVTEGRMSPLTAAGFLFAGLAVLLLAADSAKRWPAHDVAAGLAIAVVTVASTVTLGYLFGAPLLYGGPTIPMALPSGLAFVACGAAILTLAKPYARVLSPLRGPSVRARLLRAFLPTAAGSVLLMDWLEIVLVGHRDFNPALWSALAAITSMALVVSVVAFVAVGIGGSLDRAEAAARKLSCAVEHSPAAVVITNRLGDIEYVNSKFTRLTGYTAEEARGQNPRILKSGRTPPETYEQLWATVTAGGEWHGEFVNKRKNGELYWESASLSPILDAEGRITHFVGVKEDVTDRKRAEERLQSYAADLESANKALEDSRLLAEAANRAKSEFLANMSHEIRTPMTAILGYADLLLSEEYIERAPEPHRAAIQTIKRNGEHLLGLINGILDLSKVESGKMEIERVRCSPFALLAEVVSLIHVRAEEKSLPLEVEAVGPLPETVLTDPLRLRQILLNLAGNAIKFTDQGAVRLAVRLLCEGGPPRLCFEVTDTGIGMNEEQVKKLFQPFSQVDSSSTRKFGGMGLGLCISKRLAEALRGDIEVRSQPGKGSSFRVTIDPGSLDGIRMIENAQETLLDRPPEVTTATPHKIELHGRILLVEDGLDNQRLIGLLLKMAGAEVTVVENGQLAVEAALASLATGERFDVILMDMQMPVMDGCEATRTLRGRGYTGPIIALTAHSMVADRQKCLDAGCDDYVTKPVDRQSLLATVAHWAAPAPARAL
ncbi:MAG: PAS domain-containing hybrid sensor histidine kinase/response regulator [Pirellulales bacterium]